MLVDDCGAITEVLAKLIAGEPDMCVAGTLNTAEDLALKAEAFGADIVVCDLAMAGPCTFRQIAEVTQRGPRCGVVVFSAHNDGESIRRSFEAGAQSFICKFQDLSALLRAIRTVFVSLGREHCEA
jgi:DNA-binding NarL/FixJ family response regulator